MSGEFNFSFHSRIIEVFFLQIFTVRVTTLTTLNTDYIISQKVVFQYPHLFTHYFKNTISPPKRKGGHIFLPPIL